jgi:zinc protease
MTRRAILCFILCLCGLAVNAHANDKIYNAETFTLKNGMQVVLIPNHRAPIVTHMVWYKVGSADEPQGDGVSGEAHFLEHLMFKGTHRVGAGEFSKLIRSIGGEDNAFTSWDYTAYFQSISKQSLPIVMALEADRMINIAPPAKEIEPEHKVIMEERKQTIDNDPRSLFWEQLRATLYNTSPYGIPIIGWKDEMKNISWDLAKSYYDRWYAPNNAILVVSGDVTKNELKKLAEKYYGYLPTKKIPNHVRANVPTFTSKQKLFFNDKSVQQPLWVQVRLAPSMHQDYKMGLALTLLEEILSSDSSTLLYQEFVVKRKQAVEISFSYDGNNRGQGSLWVYAIPATNISLNDLEISINQYLQNIVKNGLPSSEITNAKTRMIDSALYARDSVAGPAMVIGQGLASGLTLDQIENFSDEVSKVSEADLKKVIATYFDVTTPHWITGYMEPEK